MGIKFWEVKLEFLNENRTTFNIIKIRFIDVVFLLEIIYLDWTFLKSFTYNWYNLFMFDRFKRLL